MHRQTLSRRQILTSGMALGTMLALPQISLGANDVRRIYVGFPAGGTADSLARALAQRLPSAQITYVVENKSGASGQLAAESVRHAAMDGKSLLLTPSSTLTLVPQLYRTPPYDPTQDFSPVACICDHSFGFAISARSEFTDLASFIEWAKENPQSATYASPGSGTAPHFLGVTLERALSSPLIHVPYRGVAPGLQDLMGGQVVSTFNPLPTMLELHRAGRIRLLATSSPSRLPSIPDVPTFVEAGFPSLQLVEWYGLFTGSDVDQEQAIRISNDVKNAVQSPEMTVSFSKLEVVPRYETSATLANMIKHDQEFWRGIVKSTGIKID